MAKISEQTKVQLLEEAVLSNDLETVKSLFKEYGNFEFTARALGLACRYAGLEMVELLIKNKATFEFNKTPAMVKKYQFKYDISNNESYYMSYEFFVIEKYLAKAKNGFGLAPVDLFGEYEKNNISILPLEQREKIVDLLLKKQKNIKLDVEEFTYTALCFNDKAVINALRNIGQLRLSSYRTTMLSGQIPRNQLSSLGRYEREEFRSILLEAEPIKLAEILKNISEAMCDEKIKFTKSDVYEESIGSNSDVFYSKYCAAQVFDLLVKNSNLVEVAKKTDLLYALIEQNNAEGLSYALEERWVTKEKDFEKLLNFAQEKNSSANIIATIIEHSNNSAASLPQKEDSLGKMTSSVSELKKIWGTKKKDDGTLTITSYKGFEKDVVIPSAIGKNIVTEIDINAFNTNAPRITKEQIDARCAISCIAIPGTIKTIPDNLFAFPNSSLENVVLEEGVEIVGARAFAGCKKLKGVSLPGTLTELHGAFEGCTSLEQILLPEGLKTLGANAFAGCTSLVEIDIPKGITKLEFGVFSCCGFKEFTIPKHIISIENAVFSRCRKLKHVVFHDYVDYVGDAAFSNCEELEELKNVSAKTHFGEGVLEGCKKMVDSNGFVVLNGEIQDIVMQDGAGVVEIPDYIENIPSELLWKMPRLVYKKNSKINIVHPDLKALNVGDEFDFGQFPLDKSLEMKPLTWVVISKEEEKLLAITKDSIVSLHDTYNMGNCIWSTSPLREWLNSTFYQYALNNDDKMSIVETLLSNPDNKKEKISGGAETKDKVFLLSVDEVEKYIPDMSKRTSNMTSYALTQSYAKRDSVSSWLTRTPSSWLYAKISNFDGDIDWKGNRVGFNTLRPAIWLKI